MSGSYVLREFARAGLEAIWDYKVVTNRGRTTINAFEGCRRNRRQPSFTHL